MATIINSIGTNGRNFSTIQSWVDSIPADLVAAGNSYIGELYNDSEFTATNGVFNISGRTTDSTHFITLRCATGQSFRANSNKANNPLYYNRSNGVGIFTGTTTTFNITTPYTIIDGLQIRCSFAGAMSGTGIVFKNSILDLSPPDSSGSSGVLIFTATLYNCLVVDNAPGAGRPVWLRNGANITNCTFVRPTNIVQTASTPAINLEYGGATVTNCAMFGFTGAISGTNGGYNATDFTGVPASANSLLNLTYANQFVNTTNDFRLKAGSDLINKGSNLAANYPSEDIYGTTRQTNWDIGAFEVVEAATVVNLTGPTLGRVSSPSAVFTATINGSAPSAVTVTPSDGGNGGVFNPTSLSLTTASPTGTFTYTAASTGVKTISVTNTGSLANGTPISYTASLTASAVTLTGPTTARAGVISGNFTAALNGAVDTTVVVTPNDGGAGGTFSPTTVSLTTAAPSAIFAYTGVTAGAKTITINNNGSLPSSTATITLKPPIVITPTPSSDNLIVKTIGTTGKDFSSIRDFLAYANTVDLVGLNVSIIGECYNDVGWSSVGDMHPASFSTTNTMTLQPVPGLAVADLDHGDPLDYGTEGIELTMANGFTMFHGSIIQGFRINYTAANVIAMGYAGIDPLPTIRRNRIKISGTSSMITVGVGASMATISDNLFIMTDGSTGNLINTSNAAVIWRNTFVRKGSASGLPINLSNNQNVIANNVIGDNVFINCGPAPIFQIASVKAGNVFNNFTDTALTTATPGITLGTGMVRNSLTDFRPNDSGPLIGAASGNAMDMLDLYNINRGGIPDVGAIQGSAVIPLPKVIVTSQVLNAQALTMSGTTSFSPTSGIAYLNANSLNPNGAVSVAGIPVTLTSGAFSVAWSNIIPGNYLTPVITLVNNGGHNLTQTGGSTISIIPVSANLVAGEAAPTQGNAPAVTIARSTFDNTTLSVRGAVDIQGDTGCKVLVYIDPQPNGTSLGPYTANIVGTRWTVQIPNMTGSFVVRAVGTANNLTTTVTSSTIKVVNFTGTITLPPR